MSLSGTLDTMPLCDLLQWLHGSTKSGVLTLTVDMVDTILVFARGDLAALHTGESMQRDLGQDLLGSGVLDEDRLYQAVQETRQGASLVEVLFRKGWIDDRALARIHREHTMSRVLDLFFRDEGSFLFSEQGSSAQLLTPHDLPASSRLEPAVSTRSLLFEGMRRLDEWQRIRTAFPSDMTVVRALDGNSSNPAWQILRQYGQPMACQELCLRLGSSHFDAYQTLFRAYQLGLVSAEAAPGDHLTEGGNGPQRMLLDSAQVLMAEKQFVEAGELLLMASNVAPDDAQVRSLLREVRARHLEALYQEIPPHWTPVLSVPITALDRYHLNHRETFLASRLSGRWDVATLVVAMPLGELETLRVLSKFLHAGIARLEEKSATTHPAKD
ncbi:MAG: DUF4388 domain-containing protein [Pseudomonadota bacterium]